MRINHLHRLSARASLGSQSAKLDSMLHVSSQPLFTQAEKAQRPSSVGGGNEQHKRSKLAAAVLLQHQSPARQQPSDQA
eukprot:3826228-Karenia_brevis.AAC.1